MENYDISDLYKVVSRDSGGSQNKYYRWKDIRKYSRKGKGKEPLGQGETIE